MAKKAFIISACLITIIVVVSIIISLANLKPKEFKSSILYDTKYNVIKEAKEVTTVNTNNGGTLIDNLLKYQRIINMSSIVIVVIFLFLFYGTKKSKGW